MNAVAVKSYSHLPFKIVNNNPTGVEEFLILISGLYHDYCVAKDLDIPQPSDLLEVEYDWYPESNETVNGFLDCAISHMMNTSGTFLDGFLMDYPESLEYSDHYSIADFLHYYWDDIKPYYEDEVRIALEELKFAYLDEYGQLRNSHVIEVW